MAQVRWTPQASDDLEAICRFLARDSERLAGLTAARILRAIQLLEATPYAGRAVPERERDDLRELVVTPYRVVYRIRAETCVIVCVLHGKQEFPAGVSESVATYGRSLKRVLMSMPNVGRDADFARQQDWGRDDQM